MKRPYVICHMAPSLDGRIVTTHWENTGAVTKEYERTASTLKGDAWIIGRVSMEPYAGKTRVPRRKVEPIPREDFIAGKADSYAIAIDPSGKLTWTSDNVDGEHFITILTEAVSDAYLAFLREQGVSYLFAGKTKIDLKKALEKLAARFRIRRLLLEGGGAINGSFLAADLIDELSILLVPVADGAVGIPTLFDAKRKKSVARKLKLLSVEKVRGDVVWLRYKIVR
ncbi:MAG TPA: RibD family protein [Thermoanaerobaculia bacterium]|nr:RibD family protein [Thermoanaerobaculia bacterium]